MDKQVVFKTSAIGGFDKKAVLDYVYTLNQRAEEAQARMEEQLRAVTREKEELALELQKAGDELNLFRSGREGIVAELDGERQRTAELNELVTTLNREIQQQKELVARKESELREQARLSAEFAERNKELERAKAEVDHASGQIGKLLIDARLESDNVVSKANDSAAAILAQAQAKAEQVLADAGAQARRVIDEAGVDAKKMQESAQRAVDQAYEKFSVFRAEVSGLQRSMLGALEDIHFKAGAISDAIDAAQEVIHAAGSQPIETVGFDEVSRLHYTEDGADSGAGSVPAPREVLPTGGKTGDEDGPGEGKRGTFFRGAAED